MTESVAAKTLSLLSPQRSFLRRYGVTLLSFAAIVFISAALAANGVRINLSLLIVAGLLLPAWYGGRGPGLLMAGLLEAMALISDPRPGTGSIAVYVFGHVSTTLCYILAVLLVSSRQMVQQRLREQGEWFRIALSSIRDAVVATDVNGSITFMNASAQSLTGWSAEEALGQPVTNVVVLVDEATGAPIEDPVVHLLLEKGGDLPHEAVLKSRGGSSLNVELSAQPIRALGTRVIGVTLVFGDITEKKAADSALRTSEHKLRTLVANMNEGLIEVDEDDRILFVNDSLCTMVGYSREELTGAQSSSLLFEEDRELVERLNRRRQQGQSDRYEICLRSKEGNAVWTIVGGVPIFDANGTATGSIGVFTDITERKNAERRLLHDAFHDALTGLANRALFMDHLRMTIERRRSPHSNHFAVLFLDFDRFKLINDSMGHTEGDKLLKQIARRIESCTRTGDLVARLGGDEFVILVSEMVDENDAILVAERIHKVLKTPFVLNGREIFITTSIGIALSTTGHSNADEMLRDADIAMYHAKAKGKACHEIFDQEMHQAAGRQLQFETDLRQALERGQFRMYYQPIFDLRDGTLVGFESLLRWEHPERGLLAPGEFLSIAEESGLMLELGPWIMTESCRQLAEWRKRDESSRKLIVGINLSRKEFLRHDLIEQVTRALETSHLDPRCLKLEITESHLMDNSDLAAKAVHRLQLMGVELCLDDFGTGYSSLCHLHRVAVSYLKIDRSFISRMAESAENGEMVSTIIKLARSLKMKVVAEGVETAEQAAGLRKLDCDYGQGYFFAPPLDAAAAGDFIQNAGAGMRLPSPELLELAPLS
jgi:diguanylate cyclase (GGDEF)-like protein/PAS domain S-box-containing protein